jgi:class 3 adenylate cyclase
MASVRIERRLAAILAADVVGYSRLVEQDEEGTLAALRDIRHSVIDPLLAEHSGRIVKLMGDGALAEFGSVVDAVAWRPRHSDGNGEGARRRSRRSVGSCSGSGSTSATSWSRARTCSATA